MESSEKRPIAVVRASKFTQNSCVLLMELERSHDNIMAASGSGHGGCPEGVPVELALLSILASFGVAFGVLYRALTLTTGGRKKRTSDYYFVFDTVLADVLWSGTSFSMIVHGPVQIL